jgi:hypothetical protein
MTRPWGYAGPFGLRYGEPPRDGGDYEPIEHLGPKHIGLGHAVQFLDQAGQLESGTVVSWAEQGATVEVTRPSSFVDKAWVTAPTFRYRVGYGQIRSITPPTTDNELTKSGSTNTPKVKPPDLQAGDEILLRGDRMARVQHVGTGVVHVVRDDGVYHRARPRDVAKVLRRAPRPRADQVAAPPTTQESADGEAGTSLTPELFAVNDLIAWQSGRLKGIALVEKVLPTELHVITLPGGSLVHHQRVRLTVEELRPLSVALLSTAAAGDVIRVLVQDGLEDGRVEKIATPDGVYATQAGQLAFIPSAAVLALHRSAPPRQLDAVAGEGAA